MFYDKDFATSPLFLKVAQWERKAPEKFPRRTLGLIFSNSKIRTPDIEKRELYFNAIQFP